MNEAAELSHSDDEALMALASRLAQRTGQGRPRVLSRLAGGKNNRVYRLDTDAGTSLVLKRYFSDPRDPRDRLAAEWNFLDYAWSRDIRAVPEPLACDASAHVALYGFAAGRKLGASELRPSHIDAAIDFVLALNVPSCPLFAPGSEACFTLAEHIATVECRISRLAALGPDAPHAKPAQSFVSTRLLPAWNAAQSRLAADARAAGMPMDRPLAPDECCLSPSDFGFHNALVDEHGRVIFLDFEYAGRDDPAKLTCDFFCQPEIPVPLGYHAHFIARLVEGLGLNETARARCCMLLDVYRIKWTCIILNDFLPVGSARRAFAQASSAAAHFAHQLAKAETMLAGLEV